MEYKPLLIRLLEHDYDWLDRHSFEIKLSKAEIIRQGLDLYREGAIIYATDESTVERVPGGYRWTWFEPEEGSEFVPGKEAADHFEQSGREDIAEIIRTGTKYIYGRRS